MTQEIINFQDKKYVVEDIPGKGRCYVPYKEPKFLSNLRVGDKIETSGGYNCLVCYDPVILKYGLIIVDSSNSVGITRIGCGFMFDSLDDLRERIKNSYPMSKIVK